jgi:peptidoglycan/xylan/chitin deacetylase (PgdA/CDA1 family)
MRRRYKIGITLAALLLILFGAWKLSRARTLQLFGEIVPRVETSEKVIALTFDDGPTPEATDRVLSILGQRKVKATFFLIGAEMERNPDLGRRIASEGHELGNHSFSHSHMVLKTPSFIRDEVERTDQLIRDSGYEGAIHFRPPYCHKLVLLPRYLSKTGRKTITMDIEPDSYPEIAEDSERITNHVIERARPGSIILLHVMYKSREPSLLAVAGIIDGLKEQGYEFKTVSELLTSN